MLKARDLARPAFKANPYPFYARLRKEEPVCRVSVAFVKAWLVTRYDDAVTVLRDPRISRDVASKLTYLPRFATPLTDHMLGRDPPDHTRLRSLVSKAFTPRRIEEMRGGVQDVCDALLSAVRPGRPWRRRVRCSGPCSRGGSCSRRTSKSGPACFRQAGITRNCFEG